MDKIYVVDDKVAYIASVEVVWVRIVMRSYGCHILEYFCKLVSEKFRQLYVVFSIDM